MRRMSVVISMVFTVAVELMTFTTVAKGQPREVQVVVIVLIAFTGLFAVAVFSRFGEGAAVSSFGLYFFLVNLHMAKIIARYPRVTWVALLPAGAVFVVVALGNMLFSHPGWRTRAFGYGFVGSLLLVVVGVTIEVSQFSSVDVQQALEVGGLVGTICAGGLMFNAALRKWFVALLWTIMGSAVVWAMTESGGGKALSIMLIAVVSGLLIGMSTAENTPEMIIRRAQLKLESGRLSEEESAAWSRALREVEEDGEVTAVGIPIRENLVFFLIVVPLVIFVLSRVM